MLNKTLGTSLKLLHPFMPFLTEEIYQNLVHHDESIMVSVWPRYDKHMDFPEEEVKMHAIMDVVRTIRNMRANMNIPPSKRSRIVLVSSGLLDTLEEGREYIQRLAYASELVVQGDKTQIPQNSISNLVPGIEIFIPMEDLVDLAAEKQRLEEERENLEKELERVNALLSNEGFLNKAPAGIVQEEKIKKAKYEDMMAKVSEQLKSMS